MPNKYVSHTKAFKKKYDEAQERTLEAVGQVSTGWMIAHAPLGKSGGSGYKSSIQYEVDMKEKKVTDYTDVLYAPYIEFGTGIFTENGKGRKKPWVYMDDDGEFHFTEGMKPTRIFRIVEDRLPLLRKLIEEMMQID